MGIAVAAGAELYSFGRWSSGVAWSTIKVPLAIAALRNDRPRAIDLATEAIVESDNPAAEHLWTQLGAPPDAAQKVRAILVDSGDTDTVVESRRLREGFTPFGQTHWSLSRQAQFAARLPDLEGADPVLELMRNLTPTHRWGLAAKGAAAKGGWGPGTDGSYLVRQFAVVPTSSGHAGVAMAAQADSFETGIDAVNAMADWLAGHLPTLTEQ
nr:hypothetical protein [Mycobacterium saskatchewanense]